jgi:hypothetical protein
LSSHSTARVLTVEDDPIVRGDLRLILEDSEAERRRDLILIEAMVRDGYSEGEIVAALRDRHGADA